MSTWKLALLLWVILGVVVAGAGVIVIVSVPSLYDAGAKLIPIVAGAGFVIAYFISMIIAKQITRGQA